MKIYFLMHDDYAGGGLQRSTMAAYDCLTAAGHEVQILCIRLVTDGLAGRHAFVREVTPYRPSRFSFWSNFLRELRRTVRRERPQFCIGMGLTPSVLLVLATLGMSGVRIHGSERAYPGSIRLPPIWSLLRRITLPRLDRLICQTERTAAYYRSEMGIKPDRLTVIPNVIDAPGDEAPVYSSELERFDGHPILVCVGRLEPQKGFDMALPIFAEVLAQLPEARFAIIGEGPSEAELHAQALALGLADAMLFLPRMIDLTSIWQQVDVFLLTSRFEGIPNVLGEAMAHGVASVAFDCPTGPAELITDGENGYLVPLADCEGAAKRCVGLIRDSTLRQRLAEEARKLPSRYSAETVCKLWSKLANDDS